MANQLRSEETQESTYSLPAGGPTEIKTAEVQGVGSPKSLDIWLANAKQKIRRNNLRTAGITVSMGICGLAPTVYGSLLSPITMQYVFCANMLVLVLLFVLGFKSFPGKPIWTAQELEQIEGAEAIGPLIDLSSIPGPDRDLDAMQRALSGLLRQMKEGDASLLSAEHRRLLYRIMDYGAQPGKMSSAHEEYVIAMIKACERIGDAEALRIITRLSSGQAVTQSQQTVRAAAQECLPVLQARVALLTANTTLLRGSSREQSSSEILLRPAAHASGTDQSQLLMASDVPEDPKDFRPLA